MDRSINVSAVVPAGGTGSRMGANCNKQYLQLLGEPILAHTWRVLARLPYIGEIILVVAKGEEDKCYQEVVVPFRDENMPHITVIAGGERRQDSVYRGLKQVSPESDLVLIHDGARPLLTHEMIDRVVACGNRSGACVTAVFVKDTVKLVREDNTVEKTLPRNQLVNIQTPQVFSKELILYAYEQAYKNNIVGTDDSMLVEYIDKTVEITPGENSNIKITTPEDLDLAEKVIANRRDSKCE